MGRSIRSLFVTLACCLSLNVQTARADWFDTECSNILGGFLGGLVCPSLRGLAGSSLISLCKSLGGSTSLCNALAGAVAGHNASPGGGGTGGPINPGWSVEPGDPCYFAYRDFYNAEKAIVKANKDYEKILARYERDQRALDRSESRILDRASLKDGQLTGLLFQMGITGIQTLLNKVTCDDAPEFCSEKPGQFYQLAKKYAQVLGQKTGLMKELNSIDRIQGGTATRTYNRAWSLWVVLLRAQNRDTDTYNALLYCEGMDSSDAPVCSIPAAPADVNDGGPGCPPGPQAPDLAATTFSDCSSGISGMIGCVLSFLT